MKRLLLIGDPVGHSLSPIMQNAALKAMGLDDVYRYEAKRVSASGLEDIVRAISAGDPVGANVTVPYKSQIIRHLTQVEPQARAMQSVNTLFHDGNSVRGCSTDGIGLLRSLLEHGVEPSRVRPMILGAGGAARAVALALAESAVSRFIILNRTVDKAKNLLQTLKQHSQVTGTYGRLDEFEKYLPQVNLMINCTSLGMKGRYENDSPIPTIPPEYSHLTVMDLVYNPVQTPFLKMAEKTGCRTINGVSMLVHQGAESLRLWTGRQPPISVMRQAVETSLEMEAHRG